MILSDQEIETITKALLVADISLRIMGEDKGQTWNKGIESACGEIDKALRILNVEQAA